METNLTEGKPLGLILKFTFPLFLGNMFQQIYSMADTVIVGKFVSADALAAVGSTGTISFLVLGIAIGMATGFSVMTSQFFGANDIDGARLSVVNGMFMMVIFSVIMTAGSLAVMPGLLRLMNTPKDIFSDALSYISIICLGTIAIAFYNLFAAFLRAIGNSKVPLFFLIFSSVLNIVLDLVFIINFGMGVKGAAFATITAQGVSAVLCAVYIYTNVDILRPRRSNFRLDRACCKKQLYIGIPMALETGITASGTVIMQAAVNVYGTVAVAGFTAASKVVMMFTQGLLSLGQAMASYAGQNYGAGRIDRLEAGTRDAMKINIVYSVTVAVLGALFLSQLTRMFFSGDVSLAEVMEWVKPYYYEASVFYIPLGAIFIYRNTLQGCGYSVAAMGMGMSELAARVICAVISMAVGSYYLACGADPAAWLVAGVLGLILYKWMVRKNAISNQ